MKIRDIIAEHKNEAAEIELYEAACPAEYYRGIHSDSIKSIDNDTLPDEALDMEALDWSYMDEDEYNNTVLANSCLYFTELYNENDEILVIVLPANWREIVNR